MAMEAVGCEKPSYPLNGRSGALLTVIGPGIDNTAVLLDKITVIPTTYLIVLLLL